MSVLRKSCCDSIVMATWVVIHWLRSSMHPLVLIYRIQSLRPLRFSNQLNGSSEHSDLGLISNTRRPVHIYSGDLE
jgi:hypothetical protein